MENHNWDWMCVTVNTDLSWQCPLLPCLVSGLDTNVIGISTLSVQRFFQNYHPGYRVNGEEPADFIHQRIHHGTVKTCRKQKRSSCTPTGLDACFICDKVVTRCLKPAFSGVCFSAHCPTYNTRTSKQLTFIRVTGLQSGKQCLGGGVLIHTSQVIIRGERGWIIIHIQHFERNFRAAEQSSSISRLGDEFVAGRHFSVDHSGRTELTLGNKRRGERSCREDISSVVDVQKLIVERTGVCIHVEIFHPDAKQWILDLSTGARISICCAHCQDALVSGNVLRKRGTIDRLAQHTHTNTAEQSQTTIWKRETSVWHIKKKCWELRALSMLIEWAQPS